jgi:hypothetical protein
MNPKIKIVRQQAVALLNIALLLTLVPSGPSMARAQPGDAPPPHTMSPDQLDPLVGPIALYPDPLLAQVLSAATFPSDLVMVDRWFKQHKNLKTQQLTDAVVKANLPYDPSIISLIQFPTVLGKLSQNPDWSTPLGNAFLTQRGDVMDAVQRLRRTAEKLGNLKSSEQLKVVSSPAVIEIQPANPQVIHVPEYSPQVVYVRRPPPPGPSTGAAVAVGPLSFGLGVAVGTASQNSCCWYGGSVGWSNHTVVIANNSFNRTWATRGSMPSPPPYYRSGGPYPSGRPPLSGANDRNNVKVNKVSRSAANVNRSNRDNTIVSNRRVNAGNRSYFADRGAADTKTSRGGTGQGVSQRAGQPTAGDRGYSRPAEADRSSAFSGAQNGSREQAASKRGQSARGSRQK